MVETHILHGSVDAVIFETYFKSLLQSVRSIGRRVFFMDNVPAHNKERGKLLSELEGYVWIFKASYSPNLNPIETILGAWKMMDENDI